MNKEELIEAVLQYGLEELKQLNNTLKIRQDNLNQIVTELKMQIENLV